MEQKHESVIIKFDFPGEQTVGEITKVVGLVAAKYMVPIIDALDLEANPRSSKTGSVTSDIQESIETDPMIFPFKTKGILLAASQYERLERNRYKITPENRSIEGILDGGHNTLAIGLYILQRAMEARGLAFPRGQKTWDEFKTLWRQNTDSVHAYLEALKKETNDRTLDFYIPAELLVPRDPEDLACVEAFRRELLEICAARNNNVQLPVSDKANQMGCFEDLKELLDARNPAVSDRVAWKTNDGGDIKAQDIVALAWIPLNLITPVRDGSGRTLEPVLAQNIYRNKGGCLKQFEKLMSSPEVTSESGEGYKHQLKNSEVKSAFQIAAELPELYDYIYEMFPALYNAAGGLYGRITAVKTLNEKRRDLRTPFGGKVIETVSPDGYIMPLVYGLQALMENRIVRGRHEICWNRPPMEFLHRNLGKIVQSYAGIFSMCDYDPQKIGKNPQSYAQALSGYRRARAGTLGAPPGAGCRVKHAPRKGSEVRSCVYLRPNGRSIPAASGRRRPYRGLLPDLPPSSRQISIRRWDFALTASHWAETGSSVMIRSTRSRLPNSTLALGPNFVWSISRIRSWAWVSIASRILDSSSWLSDRPCSGVILGQLMKALSA